MSIHPVRKAALPVSLSEVRGETWDNPGFTCFSPTIYWNSALPHISGPPHSADLLCMLNLKILLNKKTVDDQ